MQSDASATSHRHCAPWVAALPFQVVNRLCRSGFTRGMFTAAKRMGLHTALDTSGFLGHRADDDYLANVDLVLLDMKSGDPDTYRKVTGQDLAADIAVCGTPECTRHSRSGSGLSLFRA